MHSRFGVNLDWKKEIMINTGASQAFDALSRAFEGRYVLLPPLSLPTVGVIAAGNGAELLRLPSDDKNGMIQLTLAQFELDKLPPGSVRFLYLNSPVNPRGQVASLDYLEQIVQFARRNNITVVHDMDSWYTQHSTPGRLHNILEVRGATDCCVTVLSVSKEFGLPGLRWG
jgi:aspartate/methionine/tyrosine aminotransferase